MSDKYNIRIYFNDNWFDLSTNENFKLFKKLIKRKKTTLNKKNNIIINWGNVNYVEIIEETKETDVLNKEREQ